VNTEKAQRQRGNKAHRNTNLTINTKRHKGNEATRHTGIQI